MLDRLAEVEGSYIRIPEPRCVQPSILEGNMGMLITNSNDIVSDITDNQKKMRGIVTGYKRIANPAQQKAAMEEFNLLKDQNKERTSALKKYIDNLEVVQVKRGPAILNRENEVKKFKSILADGLKGQIHLFQQMKTVVEQKQQRQRKLVPAGVSLDVILKGNYHKDVKNAAEDLQQKIRELQRLSRSVKECEQLLRDIQIIIVCQNTKIYKGNRAIEDALDNMDKGVDQLKVYRQGLNKATKKKCIIILVALIVLAAIGVVLYKFIPW